MVVDLGEHAANVGFSFVEGADGSYACEGGSELFEDGRLGIGFESFGFSGAGDVQTCNVDANDEEKERYHDYVGGDEEADTC